ncbi:FGGY family carbohydrate kinase [Taklimakanibacter deserti]|uniref:FGGY family carbohydrate kinase n=1 Tax=Taklimakanibacter deserti TaxID=2267839 RepID=UPI000E649EB8
MRVGAIDQGTTSTRLLVVKNDEEPHIVSRFEQRQHYPQAGWVEHDPEEILGHIKSCLAAAGRLDAIAIANQGESCLAWNGETGEPVSPIIVWQDQRTGDAIERLKQEGAEKITLAKAGLPLDAYFSASKLAWILKHVPEARDLSGRGKLRLGTSDAFFLDRLTGQFATDVTTASRTSLMNLKSCAWDRDLCALFGVPLDALPEIRPTIADFGSIDGMPVVASLVDQQAALWGHGCRRAGDLKITFGTGAFALAVAGDEVPTDVPQGILPTVAWQVGKSPTYAVEAGIHDAASAINWFRRLGLAGDKPVQDFDRPPAIDRGLVFVPALTGLSCPYWDRSAAGLWIGLSLDSDGADMGQALLEGIALHTAAAVTELAKVTPLAGPISVDGGLTQNAYFIDVLASALDHPVRIARFQDLTAFGAAMLAMRALGRETAPPDQLGSIVAPRFDGRHWAKRFADAVSRARGWR